MPVKRVLPGTLLMSFLLILLHVSTVFADKILLVREHYTGPDWKTYLESAEVGHEVTLVTSMPTSLSIDDYDQFWIAMNGGQGGGNGDPFAATRDFMNPFLAAGGKIALFTDHSGADGYADTKVTHGNMETFINDVVQSTEQGNFVFSHVAGNNSTILVDSVQTVKTNPDAAVEFSTTTYQAEYPGYVHQNNIAGGYDVLYLKNNPDQNVGIAFNRGNLDPAYEKGRLFVYTDVGNSLQILFGSNSSILKIIADVTTGSIPAGFTVTPGEVAEDIGTATFTITLDTYFEEDAELTFETVEGTALEGVDFEKVATTSLTFKAGETEKTFIVPIIDNDETTVPNKKFSILFKKTANSGVMIFNGGDQQVHEVTIVDNEAPSLILDTSASGTGLPTLPDDTIFYELPDPKVYLSSSADEITYVLNSNSETTYSSEIDLADIEEDTITITATATADNGKETTKSWLLVRVLPQACLFLNGVVQNDNIADAETNKIAMNTYRVPVTLELRDTTNGVDTVIPGASITYSLGNSDPSTSYAPFDLTRADTIRAIAEVDGFRAPKEAFWIFYDNVPDVSIVATPGVPVPGKYEYIESELNVDMFVIALNDTLTVSDSVKIYYTFDTTMTPDSTNSTELMKGESVTIRGDVTLSAVAYLLFAEDESVTGSWEYDQVLPASNLIAKSILRANNGSDSVVVSSSSADTVHFGRDLDVTLESEADSIRYVVNGDNPGDEGDLFRFGDIISLGDYDGGVVTVTAIAYDEDPIAHSQETKAFVFVRDTVHVLEINGERRFLNSTRISMELTKEWQNAEIYYTFGSELPDSANGTLYRGSFDLDSSEVINAIAYADNAVESQIITVQFTKVAGVVMGWYRDSDGNGSIDQVVLDLTRDVSEAPESITVVSPFDSTETVTITNATLRSDSQVVADFPTPFSYDYRNSSQNATTFETAPLGILSGDEYTSYRFASGDNEAVLFEISDSVAPVIIEAEYKPMEIVNQGIETTIRDTLVITYSEKISSDDLENSKPFGFWDESQGGETAYPLAVDQVLSHDEDVVTYLVRADNRFQPEDMEDSVCIVQGSGIADVNDVVQENRTFWVPLSVGTYRFNWDIQVYPNPYSHSTPAPDLDKVFEGVSGNVDFESVIGLFVSPIGERSLVGSIESEIVILDMLGNMIYSSSGNDFEYNEETGGFVLLIDPKNQVGRKLGGGAYIAKLSVKLREPDGTLYDEFANTFMIGIQK